MRLNPAAPLPPLKNLLTWTSHPDTGELVCFYWNEDGEAIRAGPPPSSSRGHHMNASSGSGECPSRSTGRGSILKM